MTASGPSRRRVVLAGPATIEEVCIQKQNSD